MSEQQRSLLLADATEQARRLAAAELSSVELTQLILAAIEERNPQLNCYIDVDAKAALALAEESDQRRERGALRSAFDGLSFAVKDNINLRGFATRAGLGLRAEPAATDAFVVASLRAAGCIPLGKLNMHAAALGATNHNAHYGDCYNPHKFGYTPGGSSGGSAAAVAAGLAAFTLGTDTMGSVRLPAAYCGVVGLKAGRGAISIGGTVVLSRRLDNVGPLARSARDIATLLPLLAQYDADCEQSEPYAIAAPSTTAATVRVGIATELDSLGVQAEIQRLFAVATARFTAAGTACESRSLAAFDFGAARRAGLLLAELDVLSTQAEWLDTQPEAYPADLLKLLAWARGKSAVDQAAAEARLNEALLLVGELMDGIDYLLLPTTQQVAFAMTDPVPPGQADLTAMGNFSGYPSLTVPMGLTIDGLPAGLQILGRPGAELDMLALGQWFMDQSIGAR